MSGKSGSQGQGIGIITLDFTAAHNNDVSDAVDVPGTAPMNIGFGCVRSGGATYTVQHSFDGATFYDHPFVVGQTVSMDGNYAFPIRQYRLKANVAGHVVMTALVPGAVSRTVTTVTT